MRLKWLVYLLLVTCLSGFHGIRARLIPLHRHKHNKSWRASISNYTRSALQQHPGAKRTWECHRGCLRFCLPSCKKSCCQPGAKDFTPSMIQEIEGFQGELKGSLEQRNSINDDTEVIQAFACGQFCSPECSPSCTIGCCTGALPKDATQLTFHKHSPSQLTSSTNETKVNTTESQQGRSVQKATTQTKQIEKPSESKIMAEMPCGEYCSAQCTPTCTSECCNSRGEISAPVKNPSGINLFTGNRPSDIMTSSDYEALQPVTDKKLMYAKPMGSCHLDCEKLCLPACEFVCCVPTKMRSMPFTREVEMEFGLRKSLD